LGGIILENISRGIEHFFPKNSSCATVPPADAPSEYPTGSPADAPSEYPTGSPADAPSEYPTGSPTDLRTDAPASDSDNSVVIGLAVGIPCGVVLIGLGVYAVARKNSYQLVGDLL
jgi:hypothetical protein